MDPRFPPAANVGPAEDFAQEILREFDFGADYEFGRKFSFGVYDSSSSVGSFDYDGVSIEYSSEGGSDCSRGGRRRRRRRRGNRPKRMYRVESVKSSCWYREFLKPGPVRDLTYDLSSSDRFSEFWDFFRMPLSKVEKVADLIKRRVGTCGCLGLCPGDASLMSA